MPREPTIELANLRDYLLSAEHPVGRFKARFEQGRTAVHHCVSGVGLLYKLLDTVALTHDIPAGGLRTGDLGAIVEVHAPDAMEVEFVAASGRTQALLTLGPADIRQVGDQDLIAVRSLERTDG